MKTTTVETSKLTGPALDWAVAKAVGLEPLYGQWGTLHFGAIIRQPVELFPDQTVPFSPSTDWSQGGPLIERYCGFTDCQDAEQIEPCYAETRCSNPKGYANGATILIAVCRAIVAAELGDDVEVPAELVEVSDV